MQNYMKIAKDTETDKGPLWLLIQIDRHKPFTCYSEKTFNLLTILLKIWTKDSIKNDSIIEKLFSLRTQT